MNGILVYICFQAFFKLFEFKFHILIVVSKEIDIIKSDDVFMSRQVKGILFKKYLR